MTVDQRDVLLPQLICAYDLFLCLPSFGSNETSEVQVSSCASHKLVRETPCVCECGSARVYALGVLKVISGLNAASTLRSRVKQETG